MGYGPCALNHQYCVWHTASSIQASHFCPRASRVRLAAMWQRVGCDPEQHLAACPQHEDNTSRSAHSKARLTARLT
eukprot:4178896-Lingulodinium_polyedra.AAC.1